MSVNNKYRNRKRKRKSFLRRLLTQVGLLPLTQEIAFIYLCIFFVLAVIYKPVMAFSTMFLF